MAAENGKGQFKNSLLEIGRSQPAQVGIIAEADIDIAQFEADHWNE